MPPEWLLPGLPPSEFETEERCFITELMNDLAVAQASLALARVPPGVTTQRHALYGTVEVYVVRRGTGLMEVDGASALVSTGDRVVIPAGAAQRITNTGEQDLEFWCICTPRFMADAYVNLER